MEWMAEPLSTCAETAAGALDRQVAGAKTLLFKLARRRPFDPAPVINQLVNDWDIAMRALECLARGAAS